MYTIADLYALHYTHQHPLLQEDDLAPSVADPIGKESSRQRRRREKQEDSTERDAAQVIKEHKIKVEKLRQNKEEKERQHNEKLQRRLEKKLQKKNKEEEDNTV